MFFTRIDARAASNKIMEPHIYTSKATNGNWDNAALVPLANDSVWISHPSLSADGQQLFFAAELPGGFGGKDIYVSKKEGDKCGMPINLGSAINTVLDEVFHIYAKTMFCFSVQWAIPAWVGLTFFHLQGVVTIGISPKTLGHHLIPRRMISVFCLGKITSPVIFHPTDLKARVEMIFTASFS